MTSSEKDHHNNEHNSLIRDDDSFNFSQDFPSSQYQYHGD